MQIQMFSVDRLIPYHRNPRKNDHAVDRMAASIQEFGFKIPVLARSSGEVVDGHLRLKAACKLGLTELPVILCDEWSEAQVKAFRLNGESLGHMGRLERRTCCSGDRGSEGSRF
jgi:ParB-like chromosome segregation protein Spo0J